MVSRLFDLSGRVALITGASRGIGRAIAQGLVDAERRGVFLFVEPGYIVGGRKLK